MSLSKINNLLLALIILVNGYVILAPLWPQAVYQVQQHSGRRQQLQAELRHKKSKTNSVPATTQANRVIIPSMLLDQPVLEGPVANQYKVLNQGIWRWPHGSTPDRGGNTVLIGHRFTYTNPRGVFYFLNKVKISDEIGVTWSGRHYVYKVNDIKTVTPIDTSIENNTEDSRLTLFTCTPLWLPKDRLVVVAGLENGP